MVMRKRSAVVLLGILGVALLALFFTARRRPPPPPIIALSVLGYRQRGSSVSATVRLTNRGAGTVIYEAWGSIPYGWLKAETSTGWTNDELAPRFTGCPVVVPPGASEWFSIPLPPTVQRWKCGFAVRPACLRER